MIPCECHCHQLSSITRVVRGKRCECGCRRCCLRSITIGELRELYDGLLAVPCREVCECVCHARVWLHATEAHIAWCNNTYCCTHVSSTQCCLQLVGARICVVTRQLGEEAICTEHHLGNHLDCTQILRTWTVCRAVSAVSIRFMRLHGVTVVIRRGQSKLALLSPLAADCTPVDDATEH